MKGVLAEKWTTFRQNYEHHFRMVSAGQLLAFISHHLKISILVLYDSGELGPNYSNCLAAYHNSDNMILCIIQWKRRAPRSRPDYQASLLGKGQQKVPLIQNIHIVGIIQYESYGMTHTE